MSETERGVRAPGDHEDVREAVVPYLLLLPALLLALPVPLDLLADDPFPHLSGAGWSLLASLPLLVLLLVRGVRLGRAALLALALLLLAGVATLRPVSDPLEAKRALAQLASLVVALVAATRLTPRGRKRLELGTIGLSILWCGGALLQRFTAAEQHLAGVLGDTGSLSQAALPGAVVGAWYAASRTGRSALLGLVAALLFLLHASWAPVLAGGLAFVCTLVFSATASPWASGHSGTRRRLGGLAALGIATLILFRGLPPDALPERTVFAQPPPVEGTPAAGEAPDALGGIAVRRGIWLGSLSLIAEEPLLGVGPGQFQASFPPHRSARELELSRRGACNEDNTEVEHAHSDPIEGVVEYGLLGGALWLVLLFCCGRGCVAALRSGRVHATALGAAGLAVLGNSLVHAPLLSNPAAGPLAFAVFGAALGALEDSGSAGPAPGSRLRALAGLLALYVAFQGVVLVRHGRALTDYLGATRDLQLAVRSDEGAPVTARRADEALAALDRALAVAPRSAEARLLSARIEKTDELRHEKWLEVLEVRPYSVEAHEALGVMQARSGKLGPARDHLQAAAALSPTHPRILKNLIRLELRGGELERGLAWLERLRGSGCDHEAWIAGLGATLVLEEGRFEAGALLLRSSPLDELSPERLHGDYRDEASSQTPHVRDAYECLAQLIWARQHAENGTFRLALRNYRQAQRKSLAWTEGGALSLRLERAAAELREGRVETARELLAGDVARAALGREWPGLPSWAQETLATLPRAEVPVDGTQNGERSW